MKTRCTLVKSPELLKSENQVRANLIFIENKMPKVETFV